mgnify:FL=1
MPFPPTPKSPPEPFILPHTVPYHCTCRPNQHSASWWPRLFVDDAVDIAWDDSHKDYTDLPPAIAAAAAAEKSREEQRQRQQEERKAAAAKLEVRAARGWWILYSHQSRYGEKAREGLEGTEAGFRPFAARTSLSLLTFFRLNLHRRLERRRKEERENMVGPDQVVPFPMTSNTPLNCTVVVITHPFLLSAHSPDRPFLDPFPCMCRPLCCATSSTDGRGLGSSRRLHGTQQPAAGSAAAASSSSSRISSSNASSSSDGGSGK